MAVVTVASLGTAFADSCANSFSGFYAGLQAGVNSTSGTLKVTGFNNNAATSATTRPTTIGKKSFLGGIFAGYGMGVGSCAYVGAELYGNFGNSNAKLVDATEEDADSRYFNVSMKRGYNLGAKVRLGYTVSPQAMVFLGLGLEYSKVELKSENIQNATPQTGVETTVKKNKRNINFAPSIGMDMFLNKNVFLRGEFTYVVGIKNKIEPKQASVVNGTATIKANMTQQRFALGLGYKF